MKWSVQLSKEADSDLRGIYDYIAFCLFAPDTAHRLARRIMSSIKNLDEQPFRFPRYSEESWLSLGYRFYPKSAVKPRRSGRGYKAHNYPD